jgi:hypothetical protein
MKTTIKITIALVCISFFGLQGCYEEYAKDFDYAAVYFGEQKPLRTLVTKNDQSELVFRIGATIGGLRENKKGYDVDYELAPDLLTTVEGAEEFKLLPATCYTIVNDGNFTFHIPKGKMIGDCQVRINKNAFVALQGSLEATWAIPLRLLSTDADTILVAKNYTILVVKYIDEHSGNYYCRGSEVSDAPGSVKVTYSQTDWSRNKVRTLTTLSPTEFDMEGMGKINDVFDAADHLKITIKNGTVKLESRSGSTNQIVDLGSSYNAADKIFTLKYKYTKGSVNFTVNEQLKLRQDVEKELRFQEW